jgi:hypothetical protein
VCLLVGAALGLQVFPALEGTAARHGRRR